VGEELQKLAPAFASRHAGKRFLGYLEAQRQRLVGERGQRDVNRVELVKQFGYDTKYAMHMLRLGHQGVEFLESGRLTLPMREPVRSHLMDVRQGRSNLAEVLAECTDLEVRIAALLETSPLPSEPDMQTVENFVMDTYARAWDAREDEIISREPNSMAKALDALRSMPEDFFADGRKDDPPQEREDL
jgi:hypothetical protein